jgi:hypothetical protein
VNCIFQKSETGTVSGNRTLGANPCGRPNTIIRLKDYKIIFSASSLARDGLKRHGGYNARTLRRRCLLYVLARHRRVKQQ